MWKSTVRHTTECSIVRLEDGRIGWLGVGKKCVLLSAELGVTVKPGTEIEIILTPAQLAAAHIANLGKERAD